MSRRMLAGGVIAASVLAGGIGGALLFTPQLSGASVTTASATDVAGGQGRVERRSDVLTTAATALGITPAELRTALDSGKTIAQVAKDQGVDVQKVIDALVAQAKQRLQQAEASLPSRITDMVNGKLPVGGGHRGERGRGGIRAGLSEAATALGMTEADLGAALRSGKTIAQVANDKGVDVQKVIDAVVSAGSARIDEAVAAGNLTQEQGTARKAQLKTQVTAFVNGTLRGGGHRSGGYRPRADGASSTTRQGTGTAS
jgi:polyhydroxyalkanoate synthesis regulator phasin